MSTQAGQSINSIDEHDVDLKDWIIRVKKLQEERDREDEERNKKLEEEILAERRARHERRAQRELSLSPDRLSHVSSPVSRHSESSFSTLFKEKDPVDRNLLNSPSPKRSSTKNVNEHLKNVHDILEQKYVLDRTCKKTNDILSVQEMSLGNDNTRMYSHNTISFRDKKDCFSTSFLRSKNNSYISSSLEAERLTKMDSGSLGNNQTSPHNLSNNYSSEDASVSGTVTSNIPLESSSKSLYSDTLVSNKLLGSDMPSSLSSNKNLSLIMSDISRNQFKGSFVQSAIMKNNDSHKSPSKLSRNSSVSSQKELRTGTESLIKTPIPQKISNLNKETSSLEGNIAFSEEKENVFSKASSKLDLEKSHYSVLENAKTSIENKTLLKNHDDLTFLKNADYDNSPLKPISLEIEKLNVSPASCHEFQNTFNKSKNNFLDHFSTPDSISTRDILSSSSYKEKFGSSFSNSSKMDSFKAGILDVKNNLRPSSRILSPKHDPFKDGILNAKESLRPLSASPREKIDVFRERLLTAKSSLGKLGNNNCRIPINDFSPLGARKLNHINNTSSNASNATVASLLKKGCSKQFLDSQHNFHESSTNLRKSFPLSQDYSSLSHLSMESHTIIKDDNNKLTHIPKNHIKSHQKKNSINSVKAFDMSTSFQDPTSKQIYQDNNKIDDIKWSNLNFSSTSLKEVQQYFDDKIDDIGPSNKNSIQSNLDSELLTISFKDDINNNFFNEKTDTASTDTLIAAWTQALSKEKSKRSKPSIQEVWSDNKNIAKQSNEIDVNLRNYVTTDSNYDIMKSGSDFMVNNSKIKS
ncbi:uncharacterized protein T551_00318 [Pneumocystis jirovecii RU7]|uniref:DUF4045 domain-containing protein n=1 Tax=Pneumocystis jirovecii (strain RU7) TaxID=1408657 RepID=A0A0W4ZWT3_PNEJ7|nr:uncharacterized protein T551_00318 [Pneumocystis jirovecii RU7]KTW32833.1 hypothetical protein T551_00318 [Pneumocystis jirovecii RU7]